jgi:hypothetical protein
MSSRRMQLQRYKSNGVKSGERWGRVSNNITEMREYVIVLQDVLPLRRRKKRIFSTTKYTLMFTDHLQRKPGL